MADTGYNWGAWAFAKDDGGTDWDADALADNGTETSNTSISLDGIAACEVAAVGAAPSPRSRPGLQMTPGGLATPLSIPSVQPAPG